MRLLVCGGRNWKNRALLYNVLDEFHAARPVTLLIHGGARGADHLADDWADALKIMVLEFPVSDADWRLHGPRAGPLRNQFMLDEGKPDYVIAFAGGAGTADMVARTVRAGVPLTSVGIDGSKMVHQVATISEASAAHLKKVLEI